MSPTLYVHSIHNVLTRTLLGITDTCLNSLLHPLYPSQGDIFSGLNDGILSRAEALAAVDMQKHPSGHAHSQMSTQLKHDVMYHHGMGAPPQRPLQVSAWMIRIKELQKETDSNWAWEVAWIIEPSIRRGRGKSSWLAAMKRRIFYWPEIIVKEVMAGWFVVGGFGWFRVNQQSGNYRHVAQVAEAQEGEGKSAHIVGTCQH